MFTREDARRIELAQADQNRAFVDALRRAQPSSGASSVQAWGGWSNFAGPRSPLSQAQALAFDAGVDGGELDAIEGHLGQGGGEIRIELTPFADPAVAAALAQRGYRVAEFQQVLAAPLPTEVASRLCDVVVRPVGPDDAASWSRVVMQGFMETDDIDDAAAGLLAPSLEMRDSYGFAAFAGDEMIGGGSVGLFEGLGTLSGTGVRTAFRGRGAQHALILARLAFAIARGCDVASSSTAPGTASQRNLERCGFRVVYPKVVMVRQIA